jgi:hypothetical protein
VGFKLSTSPATLFDPKRTTDRRYAVNVFMDTTAIFATAWGETEDIARLRAGVICAAVNKLKPVDEVGLTQGNTRDQEL